MVADKRQQATGRSNPGERLISPITQISTALLAGLGGALILVGVTAPFMSRYGWDRDELYFLSASHHLAFGYVDFPPLIALVARIVGAVAPNSLVALRITSLAEGAATVVLVALIVRELGGGRRALWIGSISWALTPYILGSASIFHPTWLDALAWVGFLYAATRLLVRHEPGMWVVLGLIAGLGLEAKYTIAFLMFAFGAGLAFSKERWQLRTVWPWAALVIALVLLLPNLIWQQKHGWPSVHFFASQNAQTASGTSRPAYMAEQLLFLGATSVLAVAGIVWMWRRGLRPLALVPVIVTLVFLLERGRSYYPLPADAVAVAAGAIAADRWLRGAARMGLAVGLAAAQLATIVFVAPIIVPFYSTAHLVHSSIWNTGYFKDEIGWPELTSQVEHVWAGLPVSQRARGVVLAENYGEASALTFYGRGLGPVLSGHLSWQFWRPRSLPQRFALTVGYSQPRLGVLCARWWPLGRIENRWHLDNEERGRLLAGCSLRHPLEATWAHAIATDQL